MASNNDNCITALCRHFLPTIPSYTGRLRCLGHVQSLAAKAFLFGSNPEAFESTVEDLTPKKVDEKHRRELLECWHCWGPVGKLQNLTIAIRTTPQRGQGFENIRSSEDVSGDHLMLTRGQATSWNSTHYMIHRAVKLHYRLTEFCTEFKEELALNWLMEQDSEQLRIIERILKHFYDVTKYFEGTPECGHRSYVGSTTFGGILFGAAGGCKEGLSYVVTPFYPTISQSSLE